MRQPEPRKSPLLDPLVYRSLPIASRMYILGVLIQQYISKINITDLALREAKNITGDTSSSSSTAQVNLITQRDTTVDKINQPKITLDTTPAAFGVHDEYLNKTINDLYSFLSNDTNVLNSFFNSQAGLDGDDVLFSNNAIQQAISVIISDISEKYGIPFLEQWQEDVKKIEKGIKTYREFIMHELPDKPGKGGFLWDVGLLSDLLTSDTHKSDSAAELRKISGAMGRWRKGSMREVREAARAIENLLVPILNMGKGFSTNDQRWLIENSKFQGTDLHENRNIGAVFHDGILDDKLDIDFMQKINIKNNTPQNIIFDLLTEYDKNWAKTTGGADIFAPLNTFVDISFPQSPLERVVTETRVMRPSFEQLRDVYEDLGYDIKAMLKAYGIEDFSVSPGEMVKKLGEAKREKKFPKGRYKGNTVINTPYKDMTVQYAFNERLFLDGIIEFFEALSFEYATGEKIKVNRLAKMEEAYQKLIQAISTNKELPNANYQLIQEAQIPRGMPFLQGRRRELEKLSTKEKALYFLDKILHDGTVNNNFKNVEKILMSIVAEDPLDENFLSPEAMKWQKTQEGLVPIDGVRTQEYASMNDLKAYINDVYMNTLNNQKAMITHAFPEFDFDNLLTKDKQAKWADVVKDLDPNIVNLINKHADNFGVNYMLDRENLDAIVELIQKQDPSLHNAYNYYANKKTGLDFFKFNTSNLEDITNAHVFRQVTKYLKENPNLPNSIFTDEIIDKGITHEGIVDETSELANLIEEIRLRNPSYVAMIETDISQIGEMANDAVQLTSKTLSNLDSKYIPALQSEKRMVASYGQMLLAAQEALGEDARILKYLDGPDGSMSMASNFAGDTIFSIEGVKEVDDISSPSYGLEADEFQEFSERGMFDDIDLSGETDFDYPQLNEFIDELMHNDFDNLDKEYLVFIDGEFETATKGELINVFVDDLLFLTTDNAPSMNTKLNGFLREVISYRGDILPNIAQRYSNLFNDISTDDMGHPVTARKTERMLFNEPENTLRVGKNPRMQFSTLVDTLDGKTVHEKYPGMTINHVSNFKYANNGVEGQSFINHALASAAKEIAQEFNRPDVAQALLDIENMEVDDWKYFNEEVLKELKNIILSSDTRFDGKEGLVVSAVSGYETPAADTKSTLVKAHFDTLAAKVVEGKNARMEMLLVPPNAKSLDMSKFVTYSRNNAMKNMVVYLPGQGLKALKGSLQALQDPVLSQLIDAGQLEDIEQIVDVRKPGTLIEPVDGKYQFADTFSFENNTLANPKGPLNVETKLNIEDLVSPTLLQKLIADNEITTLDGVNEILNKKNFIIQTMQEAAKKVNTNLIKGNVHDQTVAYIRTSSLLKMLEDNRLEKRASGLSPGETFGRGNINNLVDLLGRNGWVIPEEMIKVDGPESASTLADRLSTGQSPYKLYDLPKVRYNPNNNAAILIEGNHRVQAANIWELDYIPVIFEIDPHTVKPPNKFGPLFGGLGTKTDLAARIAGGVDLNVQPRGYNAFGTWKKRPKFLNKAEINKTMLNALSTVSDYLTHPKIPELLTYSQLYTEAFTRAASNYMLSPQSWDKTDFISNASEAEINKILSDSEIDFATMDEALKYMKEWIDNYFPGTAWQDAINTSIKYHPTAQDFAAIKNSHANRTEYKYDVFLETSRRTGLPLQDVVKGFEELPFNFLMTKLGDGVTRDFIANFSDVNTVVQQGYQTGKDKFILPINKYEDLNAWKNTRGKFKGAQNLDPEVFKGNVHSVFELTDGLAKSFLDANPDLFGTGNMRSLEDGLEFVSTKPIKTEIVGPYAGRFIHSEILNNILTIAVNSGTMTEGAAVGYRDAQAKVFTEKLFDQAKALGKGAATRLRHGIGTGVKQATKVLEALAVAGVSNISAPVGLEYLKLKELDVIKPGLQAASGTKVGRGARAAGKALATLVDIVFIPLEALATMAATIRYYDDPEFGKATGLGRHGVQLPMFASSPDDILDNHNRFRNHNALTRFLKGTINGIGYLGHKLTEDSDSPMFRPAKFDAELMGKNFGQYYFGMDFEASGLKDGLGGDPTFVHLKKQPFFQDMVYGLARAFEMGPQRVSMQDGRMSVLGEQEYNKQRDDFYNTIGQVFETPEEPNLFQTYFGGANMEGDNG